ncbi:MAG: tRNA pseudouridine(38-40) synthase TruA [Alphaproteobacteria bacterium]|jgi:tRNA pseudouridine38-40 synthase|nr:tRNA pseudouridine(38-40) synthase TruA [Alphaproteobacteria bacterium]
MPRYALTIEYDGGPFVGWQRQTNGPSVQEAIETAVERFCGEAVRVHCAGRTDAGVHARGQVAHLDLAQDRPAGTLRDAVNFYLKPHPVTVLVAGRVPDDFDARRSAIGRAYLYRLVNRRAPLALERGRAWHIIQSLDNEAMHAAAQILVGRHDFTSFRAAECQAASPVKTLDRLDVRRAGEEIAIIAEARSFLHHQVRNMVGTLALVGRGRWTAADVRRALAACNRAAAGPTAPPQGLYLMAVRYPPHISSCEPSGNTHS